MADGSGADPELEAALDSFLDWADHAEADDPVSGLPPVSAVGIEPGAVFGDFELVRRLGAGGMGVVFEARQLSVDRRVAVKLLRSPLSSERLAARFKREVTIVGELDHPVIVPVVAAGMEQGLPWYAMKFVEGTSVARLLRDLRAGAEIPDDSQVARTVVERLDPSGERASSSEEEGSAWETSYPRWAARFVLQVAEALQHAHDRHVVHRDVKPGNLMITPRGRPVVLDFGLARGEEDETLTSAGDFLGTLAYASPEQTRGVEAVDGRTDVYSLGATLYELLTLRRPFEAPSRSELLRRIQEEEPSAMDPALPAELRAICLRALARSPERRYATAAALARDLRAFLQGEPVEARLPGPLARAVRTVRRHPRLTVAFGVAVLVLIGFQVRDRMRAGERVVLAYEHIDAAREERELLAELAASRARGADDGQRLGAAMRGASVALERALDEAEGFFVQAFQHVAGHGGARRGLAEIQAARLRAALDAYADLYDPDRVRDLGLELRRFDDDARHAPLLVRTGHVSLASEPSRAHVEIRRDQEGAPDVLVFEGATPIRELVLEEGSYVATLTAAGHAAAPLPFVVRRDACYAAGTGMPPREHLVRLLRREQVPAQYVYVPGGWTLVEDDPPLWQHVESFLIRRFEVTNAELVGWLNAGRRLPGDPFRVVDPVKVETKPRFSESDLHVERCADGIWQLTTYHDPDWPARGLSPMDMGQYAGYLSQLEPGGPEGWYDSLPTHAEWVRAARGADARPWPWGREFSWENCAGYPSGEVGLDPRPFPVGSFPGDVSPFGVRDLAGSIAEVTQDSVAPLPDRWILCGGSFDSRYPREARILAPGAIRNEPRPNAGFRPVKRPQPAWMLSPDRAPEPFSDDFERPDSADVGNGWVEGSLEPLSAGWHPGPTVCSLDSGRLVCEAGLGNFSFEAAAWHRVHLDATGYSVRAIVDGRCKEEDPTRRAVRSYGLRLRRGFELAESHSVLLSVTFDGGTVLQFFGPGGGPDRTGPRVDPSGPLHLELRVEGDRLTGSVRPVGAPPSDAATLELPLPAGFPAPRYLGVFAKNYVGALVEVEEIEVRPGP